MENFRNLIHKDGLIDISESLWKDLNKVLSKEEIISLISDVIEKENIPLPYRNMTLDETKSDFYDLWSTDCSSLINKQSFYSRYEYNKEFSSTIVEQSKVGNKSSDYFHQENRWKCDSINAPSPYRTWHTEKFRKTLLNGLWTLKYEKVDMGTLRSLIGLRKYIAAQFRPSAAKAIYQHFEAQDVLDFSSGWGDRLSAALATNSVKSYLGVDPNQNLIDGYNSQIQMAKEITGINKNAHIISLPAEDIMFPLNSYDLVFTSPPYFIIERYTQEKNQSWKRYKKIDQWLEKFLFNVLEKSWYSLKSGGHMVINISDVYCNHTNNKICDPMCDFIDSFSDSSYVGCWGLKMSKRPNSKAVGDGVFAEPIWIWKKK